MEQENKEHKRASDRAYYQAHKEEIKARTKAWAKSHSEYVSEWQKKYREAHKNEIISYKKTYYSEHKEEDNARCRAWRKANRDRKSMSDKNSYEARKKNGMCLNCGKITKINDKFCSHECYRDWNHGENSGTWKGGLSFEPYCPKFSRDLKRRIRAFFGDKCLMCGISSKQDGRELSCHHVEYNKQACCDGKPVHFAALCSRCHGRSNHETDRWESMLHRIIDEIYEGRSYYTKEEYREIIT